MGFINGVLSGFGCMGQGCGFLIGIVLFLAVASVFIRACGG
jgi:hypothetical protein